MKTRIASVVLLLRSLLTIAGHAAEPNKSKVIADLEAGKKQRIVAYGTSLTAAGTWVKQIEDTPNERYHGLVKITNSGGMVNCC